MPFSHQEALNETEVMELRSYLGPFTIPLTRLLVQHIFNYSLATKE